MSLPPGLTGTFTEDHARATGLVSDWWRWDEEPSATFLVEDTVGLRALRPTPVAALRLFPRTLATPHLSAPAIGLGGVFVTEAYRGQGIAGRMLADCCARLAAEGHLFAVLWARSHRDLYQRAGFVEVDPQLWVKSLRADVQVHRGRYAWRCEGARF